MYSKRLAATVAAGVLVMSGLATGTANAAAPLTDTVRIVGNYDNGNHGYWASLAYNRTVTIDRAGKDTWSVTLRDAGTFTTLRNAKSPAAGVKLGTPVTGNFSGTYAFTVKSKFRPSDRRVRRGYDFRCNPAGTGDRATDCSGMPKATGEWPALYFPQAEEVKPGAWRWEYRTCAETWVNSSAGDQGDITGKRCDRRKEATAPTVVQPECDAAKGKLVIPSDRGVTYKVRTATRDYRTVRAGEYDVRPGVYRVTAHAKPGVRLVGVDRWRLEVEAAEACPTPTPTPTATDEPTPDPTPTVEPTVEPEPTEEPEPTPTVTETRTNTQVIVINDTRVPDRVDTGFGGLAK
jgi:hypothetical protein